MTQVMYAFMTCTLHDALISVFRHRYSRVPPDDAIRFGQFIQFDYGQATFGMPDHVKILDCTQVVSLLAWLAPADTNAGSRLKQ